VLNRARTTAAAVLLAAGLAATAHGSSGRVRAADAAWQPQTTHLISVALDGVLPNGTSTNAVISPDRRFARLIAFQSDATNLVRQRTNGLTNVYAVERAGRFANNGSSWFSKPTVLVSRGMNGQPANGSSVLPSVSGDFKNPARCIAFVSSASNLVRGDTNGKADAFLVRRPGAAPARVSLLPNGRQTTEDVSAVAVSGDCSRVSFVAGGQLYTRIGHRTRHVRTPGAAAHPSYGVGFSVALVYDAPGGVYLSEGGTRGGKLIAPGGSEPSLNDIHTRTVAYTKSDSDGHTQVFWRDLGRPEQLASKHHGTPGSGDSSKPSIGNSGLYVAFQTDAPNLQTDAAGATRDDNGRPDVYLYTRVRDITLLESTERQGTPLPAGGVNPSMSYYANYILFDSPAPLGASDGNHAVYMRYVGGL
jgi:hypothetical protein